MQNTHVMQAIVSLATCLCVVAPAIAAQYPVTGTVTINGTTGALPAGGTFGDSIYDPTTGYLSAGQFVFSVSTFTDDSGDLVITYQLSQNNTSSALVGSDDAVAFTTASLQLSLVSATYFGLPIAVTPCNFSPVVWDVLGGMTTPSGLQVSQASFSVPQTSDSCGGFSSQINDALQGNQNSIDLLIAGSFPPPSADDRIFSSGFEAD